MERLQQVTYMVPPCLPPATLVVGIFFSITWSQKGHIFIEDLKRCRLCCCSVLEYDFLNLEVPTISIVGSLIRAGIPVLVYR